MPLRLKPLTLNRLREFQGHFEKVERATGVPWEAIAAIWFREGMHVVPPATPGGPFQFDPIPDDAFFRFLLNKYSTLTNEEKESLIKCGANDFYAATYLAACFARNKCKPKITPAVSDTDILYFFWGYNGRAKYHKGDPRNSFYVYNGFDKDHDGMLIVGSIPDGKGGRKRIRTTDKRPGAFVVYKQLKGEL